MKINEIRNKSNLTDEEIFFLMNNLGNPKLKYKLLDGKTFLAITDSTNYTTYHSVIDELPVIQSFDSKPIIGSYELKDDYIYITAHNFDRAIILTNAEDFIPDVDAHNCIYFKLDNLLDFELLLSNSFGNTMKSFSICKENMLSKYSCKVEDEANGGLVIPPLVDLHIDLTDALDSKLYIDTELTEIGDGNVTISKPKNTSIKYLLQLDGWKDISGSHKFTRNKKLKLNWIKDE